MYSRAKAWPLCFSPAEDYLFYLVYIYIYIYQVTSDMTNLHVCQTSSSLWLKSIRTSRFGVSGTVIVAGGLTICVSDKFLNFFPLSNWKVFEQIDLACRVVNWYIYPATATAGAALQKKKGAKPKRVAIYKSHRIAIFCMSR